IGPAAGGRGRGRLHDSHHGRSGGREGVPRRTSHLIDWTGLYSRLQRSNTDRKVVSPEGMLATGLLLMIVVLAIVSARVVGRRAARTVDQVTALLERNEARFRAMVRDSNDI